MFICLNSDLIKSRSNIWVRPWAAAHLNGQSWSGERSWKNLSFIRQQQGDLGEVRYYNILTASRRYVEGDVRGQVADMEALWAETQTLEPSRQPGAQARLLRAFLTLNMCPVLDTVLCDKRSFSAHMRSINSPSKLHPTTTLYQLPPFITTVVRNSLLKLPSFPLKKVYFLKDPALNLGRGITVLPKFYNDESFVLTKLRDGFLLQEEVEDPVLLGEFKFTFRLYLFAQSVKVPDSFSNSGVKRPHQLELFLSTNGNTAASHTPYYQGCRASDGSADAITLDIVSEGSDARASLVTNQCSQVNAIASCGKSWEGCPAHPVLPLRHRLWHDAQTILEEQHGKDVFDKAALRDDIKRIVSTVVKPSLSLFSAAQTETSAVLSNSSLSSGSILNTCQALYGLDLMLQHNRAGVQGKSKIDVQLLEVQMEPNTLVKCEIEEALYADLAAGVWQIITKGSPVDEDVFEKLNF